MLFSIIVPVYNVEPYLEECLRSVLEQSFADYEILLVNDGSTDNSGQICEDFAKKDPRIRVFHQRNSGLSVARNVAMKAAQGDYFVFVDSDDALAENALQTISEAIQEQNPDVISGYTYRMSAREGRKDGISFCSELDSVVSGWVFFERALRQNKMRVGPPSFVVKRTLWEENQIMFYPGIYHEDDHWTVILLYYAQRVLDLKVRWYIVRCDNMTSITRDPAKAAKRARDRVTVSRLLADFFDGKEGPEMAAFHDNISAQYMYAIYSGGMEKDPDVDRFFPLSQARTGKYRAKALLFALSPSLACKLRKHKK